MENIEIFSSEEQSEILSEQPSNGYCSNTEMQNEIDSVKVNKGDELISDEEIETLEANKEDELMSDEEIDLHNASSLDSETDGWEKPQQFGKNYISFINLF